MEYKELYPSHVVRPREDKTLVDIVKMLVQANRENEAMERIISQLHEEIRELEDAFAELSDDYNTLEEQFIAIGGAEEPAMRG